MGSEKRDIIDMRSMKTLLLAIFILFFLLSNISAKPSPKHFLVEAKDKAKKNNDYIARKNNDYDVFPNIRDNFWTMCIHCINRDTGARECFRNNLEDRKKCIIYFLVILMVYLNKLVK